MGKKDILKVECDINTLNLDILGFIDHNITVNVVKNCEIVKKLPLTLPKEIRNVLKCKNPKCITNNEPMQTKFHTIDKEKAIFKCHYCERIINSEELVLK